MRGAVVAWTWCWISAHTRLLLYSSLSNPYISSPLSYSFNLLSLRFTKTKTLPLIPGSSHPQIPAPRPGWGVDQSDHCPGGWRDALRGPGGTDRIPQHGPEEQISARNIQSSKARGDGSQTGAQLPAQASPRGETYITVIANLPYSHVITRSTYILHS